MGALDPSSLFSNSTYNWLFGSCSSNKTSSRWTKEENKEFERALAIYDENTTDRWFKVAALIPGKSVWDVMKQYNELVSDVSDIEAGLVPIPGYLTSPFTLEWVDNNNNRFDSIRKGASNSTTSLVRYHHPDQERKKGVPWTEDEHRRFLLGLQKHGKGDWRNISRNFVITKSPTQVASHAQKYFLRQNSGGKDKRRPSIHDITTPNVTNPSPPMLSETDHKPESLIEQISSFPLLQKSISIMPKMLLDWNTSNPEALMAFNSSHGQQNLYSTACHGASVGSS